jgi:hypothetical protein
MNESGIISIHSFKDIGFNRLAELSKLTYAGKEISDPDYLHWEYVTNPDGIAVMNVAESGQDIISQYIVLPRSFSLNGTPLMGSLSVNTLTHPAFRGHGLFPRLSAETFKRCREKEIHFTIGFPNPVSSPVIRRKKILDHFGSLSLLIDPLRPVNALFRYITGRKNKSGAEIELHVPLKYYEENKNISEFNFDDDKHDYEKFINDFNHEKKLTTLRTPEFLKWRYGSIPIRKYLLLKYSDENGIKAVAMIRAKHIYGLRCGIVVDFVSNENVVVRKSLVNFIRKIARYNELHLVIATFPARSGEAMVFRQNGFYNAPRRLMPQQLEVIIRSHTESCPPDIANFNNWFLTFGDYDIF